MQLKNLPTLTLHELSAAQYKREYEAGRIDEDALYLTPDAALIVTLDEENGIASHTSQEIYEYMQNGGLVYVFSGYEYSQPSFVNEDYVWVCYIGDDSLIYYIGISSDGHYEIGDYQLAPPNSYTMSVYLRKDQDGLYIDFSPAEIRDHIINGGSVALVVGPESGHSDYHFFSLVEAAPGHTVFEERSDDGQVVHYEINNDNRVIKTTLRLTTDQHVESRIAEAISELPTYEGTYREIYTGEVEDV